MNDSVAMTLTFAVVNTAVVMHTSVAMAVRGAVNQRRSVAVTSVALTTETVVLIRNTAVPLDSRAVTKQSAVALATIIVVANIAVRLVPTVARTGQVVTRTDTSVVEMGCPVPRDLSVADRKSVADRGSNAAELNAVRKIQSVVQRAAVQCKLC